MADNNLRRTYKLKLGIDSYQLFLLLAYWMISALWPQLFSLPSPFYFMPTLPYCGSIIPGFVEYKPEQKQEELVTATRSREGSDEEQTKEPKRRTWTVEEDQKLLEIIKVMNFPDGKRLPYHKIAKEFRGRTSKQIRQRYLNHLNSSINKDPFTKQQDEFILKYYTENGPRWKKLSLILKGRTSTSLKNRFNTKLKQTLTCLGAACESTSSKVPTSSPKSSQQNLSLSGEHYTSQKSL